MRLGAAHDPTAEHRAQQYSERVARRIHQDRFGHHAARFPERHPTRNVLHPRTAVEHPGVVRAPRADVVQQRILEEQQSARHQEHAVKRDSPFPSPGPDDEVVQAGRQPDDDHARPGHEDRLHEHRRIARPRRHPLEIGSGHPPDPHVQLESQDYAADDGPDPNGFDRD